MASGVHEQLKLRSHLILECLNKSLAQGAPASRRRQAGPVAKALARSVAKGVSERAYTAYVLFPCGSLGQGSDFLFISPGSKVSEHEACGIAGAIWREFSQLDGASSVPSSGFLEQMARLHRTGHENKFTDACEAYGLKAACPVTFTSIGLKEAHPVLRVRDFIQCLAENRKMELFLTGHGPGDFKRFWEQWRPLYSQHEIFKVRAVDLQDCIPIFLHMDEGTSVKKRPLFIAQWQPVLGTGSSRGPGDLNFKGSSIKTRFLFSCMMGKVYGGKQNNKPLMKMINALALELRSLFYNGVQVELHGEARLIYPICIGVKGDWAGLAKVGNLRRTFMNDAPTKEFGQGICHLCKAGMKDFLWHHVDYDSMARAHQDPPLPWPVSKVSPLIQHIPGDPSQPAELFKIDVFHTCHKGVMGDAAANGIAT